MKKPLFSEPLTDEERRFAGENYGLVPFFLERFRVGDDDLMYDCVVSGFMRAVKKYFAEERLRKYKFGTIFEWQIRSFFEHLHRSRHRKSKYLQQVDFVCYGVDGEELNVFENIPDECDQFEAVHFDDYFEKIIDALSEGEKELVMYLINGYNQSDIARKMDCSRTNINQKVKIIRKKISSYIIGNTKSQEGII